MPLTQIFLHSRKGLLDETGCMWSCMRICVQYFLCVFFLIYLARPSFKATKLIGDISKLKLLLQDNSIEHTAGVHLDG